MCSKCPVQAKSQCVKMLMEKLLEMNKGMIVREVARVAGQDKVVSIPKVGGEIHHSTEILHLLKIKVSNPATEEFVGDSES